MKPRELTDEECSNLLASSRYGRLGLSVKDQPYVIPMSYVYADGAIYLHSRSKGGKKLEMAKANPNVCFEIDALEKDRWKSVVVTGKATISDAPEAKGRMFDAFMASGIGGHGGKAFDKAQLDKMEMTVWSIEISEITGREGIW